MSKTSYRKAAQARAAKLAEQRRLGEHEAAPKVFGPARDPRPGEVLRAAAAGADPQALLAAILKGGR